MICLRSLLFKFETREQISKLITETLKRLTVAADNEYVTPQTLWGNIYAIMTDAVAKNLKIEEIVAEKLGSDHVPKHFLCKSHCCEKLDESCVNVLIKIEADIGYVDMMIKRQPRLKQFIRQSRCLVIAAMQALLKLSLMRIAQSQRQWLKSLIFS